MISRLCLAGARPERRVQIGRLDGSKSCGHSRFARALVDGFIYRPRPSVEASPASDAARGIPPPPAFRTADRFGSSALSAYLAKRSVANIEHGDLPILERHAGEPQTPRLANQPDDLICSARCGKPSRLSDVRHAVALAVAAAGSWIDGYVSAEAIDGAKAWPFADHHHHHASAQGFPDRIADGDARLARDDHRRKGPISQTRGQRPDQRGTVRMHCGRRKTISDH
jgi:hypothetical protein